MWRAAWVGFVVALIPSAAYATTQENIQSAVTDGVAMAWTMVDNLWPLLIVMVSVGVVAAVFGIVRGG